MEGDIKAELIALRIVVSRLLLDAAGRDRVPLLWLDIELNKMLSFVDDNLSVTPPDRTNDVRALIKEALRATYALAASPRSPAEPLRVISLQSPPTADD